MGLPGVDLDLLQGLFELLNFLSKTVVNGKCFLLEVVVFEDRFKFLLLDLFICQVGVHLNCIAVNICLNHYVLSEMIFVEKLHLIF